jgi:hypothetical protein
MLSRKNSRAESSGQHAAHGSPFRPRPKNRGRGWMALFLGAAIAVLALLAGMIAVSTITAPTP